ncbi:hypothetical protein ACFXPT_06030 [Streptomyces goshikiensis]|uniref:hypothetical protein n=1 Tax=Streptomyces goshikiensis TaxID=1942 RepID=UPI00369F9D8A
MIKSHCAIITRQPAQIPTPRHATPSPWPRPPWIQPWSASIIVILAGGGPVEARQQCCRLVEAHDPARSAAAGRALLPQDFDPACSSMRTALPRGRLHAQVAVQRQFAKTELDSIATALYVKTDDC